MLDRFLGGYVTASPTLPTQSSAQGVWELEQQASAQVQNAWPLPPNVIQRSLRFNAPDSAYLSRTPAAASNRKTWTWSGWVKRTTLGGTTLMFGAADGSSQQLEVGFNSDSFYFSAYISAPVAGRTTTAKYRDVSAWYHTMCVLDMTQATASDRVKLYVNGVQITDFTTNTNAAQNTDLPVNNTIPHAVGREEYFDNNYFAGYMAEVNFIDGQALTPSSFGETDAQTGVWVPKRYTGTYGTNGFRLPFTNNSTTTALGYDASGNGNNWTPNNFSVTAGSGNDSLLDVPSLYGTDTGLGGEVRGNYATLNPLSKDSAVTLSNGNLEATAASAARARPTINPTTGKWYHEVTISSIGTATNDWVGGYPFAAYRQDGYVIVDGTNWVSYGASWTTGDIIGVAFDFDNSTATFYKNGVSQGQKTSTGGITTSLDMFQISNNGVRIYNFGQRPFAYTAPTGFKALCTTNLSASGTVTSSGTFTGNASTDGPFVYLNGVPVAMTINGNAVTFGTQADKLSNGFKVRSSSASYNTSGSNTYSITTNTGPIFRYSNAQGNP